jgi:hypothetical protein
MDIALILLRKYVGSEWCLDGNTYDRLTWLSEGDAPTEKELESLWPSVQKEIKAEAKAVEDARLSAIAKLGALGLTVDEVQAAFGLKA